MRKLKFVLPAAILVGIFSVTFTSCSKKTTNTTVVADSVLYSNWVPLNMQLIDATDSNYEQVINASAVNAKVLNTGAINVYGNYNGSGGTAIALVQDFGIYPSYTTGQIILDAFGSGILTVEQYDLDSVRYVIIPGKVATTDLNGNIQTYTAAQLKTMDYSTLSKVLNIPARGTNFKQ